MALASGYLTDITRAFRGYKMLGEASIAQVSDHDLHTLVDPETNSIAIIVKHLAGNLRSRFTDFLTADGEKPDRDRDTEFVMNERPSRAQVIEWWDSGWAVALGSVEALTADDLERTVRIRGEGFAVFEALNRSVTHAAYHVGQIALLAKHFAGPDWKSLSIPKGESTAYARGSFKQGMLHRRAP
jgi:hypothetical protein